MSESGQLALIVVVILESLLIAAYLIGLAINSKREKKGTNSNRVKYKSAEEDYLLDDDQELNEPESDFSAVIAERVLKLLEKEKVYLNPRLKIQDVVKLVGTNRNYLSKAINTQFPYNFNQLCNYFRVREACRIFISNPKIKRDEWVRRCGFDSASSFSNAFVGHTKYAPAKWRREVLLRLNNNERVKVEEYLQEINIKLTTVKREI